MFPFFLVSSKDKKELVLQGGRNPRALNKRTLTQAKKTSEPLPHPYIGAPLLKWVWAGTFLYALAWWQARDSFNPRLKFTAEGSQTQDLRSATKAI